MKRANRPHLRLPGTPTTSFAHIPGIALPAWLLGQNAPASSSPHSEGEVDRPYSRSEASSQSFRITCNWHFRYGVQIRNEVQSPCHPLMGNFSLCA